MLLRQRRFAHARRLSPGWSFRIHHADAADFRSSYVLMLVEYTTALVELQSTRNVTAAVHMATPVPRAYLDGHNSDDADLADTLQMAV